MVCGARVDQTSIASTMKLAYVGPRFGYIGQMCTPFEPQTLFQKPMGAKSRIEGATERARVIMAR